MESRRVVLPKPCSGQEIIDAFAKASHGYRQNDNIVWQTRLMGGDPVYMSEDGKLVCKYRTLAAFADLHLECRHRRWFSKKVETTLEPAFWGESIVISGLKPEGTYREIVLALEYQPGYSGLDQYVLSAFQEIAEKMLQLLAAA